MVVVALPGGDKLAVMRTLSIGEVRNDAHPVNMREVGVMRTLLRGRNLGVMRTLPIGRVEWCALCQ